MSVAWGEIIDGARTYPLHEGQRQVLMSRQRFTAGIAGTGGGKTAIGPLWLMIRIRRILAEVAAGRRDLVDDPMQFMVVAPTYKVMSRATAPTLVRMFRGTDFEGTFVPSRNIYLLPDSLGEIYLLSADQPGSLEGGQQDGVWIDEGGQLKYDAWIALQGRTGLKMSPILITTTPYGRNWLFHEFYKRAKAGDRDYFMRQWSSIANPAYSKKEYDRASTAMGKERFAMRYDGQFVKMAGLVYPDLDTCFVPASTPVPPGKRWGGIDFGWNNPFACLAGTLFVDEDSGKDILYIWYERYKRLTSMRKHALAIPRKVRYQADPSRPDSIAELRKANHLVNKAYNDILVGIDAVNERIYTNRLWISDTCKAVKAEGDSYAYPTEDDETWGEKPVDEMNHAMDALRYTVAGVDRLKIAREHDKAKGDEEELYDAA